MATIKVKAAPGLRFPLEHSAKTFITDEVVEVKSSVYYRRALADGDLILATDAPEENTAKDVQNATPAVTPAPVKSTKKASQNE